MLNRRLRKRSTQTGQTVGRCSAKGINECRRDHNSKTVKMKEGIEPYLHLTGASLDLCLMVSQGLCWSYGKESPKPVLPASSIHPKSAKKRLATALPSNALHRSCVHQVASSLAMALQRLFSAGYSRELISAVASKILKKNNELTVPREIKGDNWVAILFFHSFSQLTSRSKVA